MEVVGLSETNHLTSTRRYKQNTGTELLDDGETVTQHPSQSCDFKRSKYFECLLLHIRYVVRLVSRIFNVQMPDFRLSM